MEGEKEECVGDGNDGGDAIAYLFKLSKGIMNVDSSLSSFL